MRARVGGLVGLVLLAAAGTAEAGPRAGDAVLFARDGAVWKVPAAGGEAVKVVEMDAAARGIEKIEVGGDGSVLVRAGRARRWVRGDGVRGVGCGVGAEAGTGTGAGTGTRTGTRELGWDGQMVRCAVDGDTDVVLDAKGKRWTERVERGEWLAGSAGRAVAVEDGALVVFRLDARKARRVLVRGAEPVTWSADGQWLLARMGASACIVRAVGGQFKCWSGYQPVAIAGDGSYAVLGQPAAGRMELYRAQATGARAESPALLVRDADGPAAWMDAGGPADAQVSPPEPEEEGSE